jgi:hypothetical protein
MKVMRGIGRSAAAATILVVVWTNAVSAAAKDTIFLKCIGTKEWSGADLPNTIDNKYIEYFKVIPSSQVFTVYWLADKRWGPNQCRVTGTKCTFNDNVFACERRSYLHISSSEKHIIVDNRLIDRKTGKSEGHFQEQVVGNNPAILQIVLTHTKCEISEEPRSHFTLKSLFRFGK